MAACTCAGSMATSATLRPHVGLPAPRPRQGHTFGSKPKAAPLRVAHISHGLGSDVAGGFLDLAKLVSSGANSQKTPYDDLAYRLGQDVYADLQGWHLFLKDMRGTEGLKMSQVLAQGYAKRCGGKVDEKDLEELLKQMPVKLGGGKLTVSLFELIPAAGIRDAVQIFKDFERDL